MNLWYVTRRRGEILIAFLRIAMVSFAVLWMQPHQSMERVLLTIIAVIAVGLVAALRWPYFRSTWRLAVHGLDFAWFALIVHLAPMDDLLIAGLTAFLLLTAMLRFEWDGIVATGLAASCFVAWRRVIDPSAIVSRDMLFIVALVILTCASAAFSRYLLRRRIDVATILSRSMWPRTLQTLLREQLENAAVAMRVPRVAFVWRDPGAECELALWNDEGFRTLTTSLRDLSQLSPPELDGLDFFCSDALSGRGLFTAFGRMPLRVPVIDRSVIEALGARSLLVARFEGSLSSGALLYLDGDFDSDDLMLARLTGEVISSRVDFYWNSAKRERLAAGEERSRIARDLHDGILQSLGGVSMQLEAAGKRVSSDPAGAREIIRKIQDILAVDQHEIRSLVDGMRMDTPSRQIDLRSGTRFSALAALVRMQWGADLDLRLDSLDGKVEKGRRREIHRLVREAVVNAAKHAEARHIVVEGGCEGSSVRILVRDDGRGFPFLGRFELADLMSLQQGPTSLKERITLMGGSLVIDSRRNGSTVEITVPNGASS